MGLILIGERKNMGRYITRLQRKGNVYIVSFQTNSCANYPFTSLPEVNATLGLFKKHQLWILKAGLVVSHGVRHAEFNGARKYRFQALLGVANLISFFLKMHGRSKMEIRKSYQIGA